jgi:hypothetical protein
MSWHLGLPSFLFVVRILDAPNGPPNKLRSQISSSSLRGRVIQKGAPFNRGRPDTFPFTLYKALVACTLCMRQLQQSRIVENVYFANAIGEGTDQGRSSSRR